MAATKTHRKRRLREACGTSKESPSNDRVHDAEREEGTEDLLVVLREPQRQVDVEVLGPVRRVARRDARKRATQAIHDENRHLAHDDSDQDGGKPKLVLVSGQEDAEDAEDEDRPDQGVKGFDQSQHAAIR